MTTITPGRPTPGNRPEERIPWVPWGEEYPRRGFPNCHGRAAIRPVRAESPRAAGGRPRPRGTSPSPAKGPGPRGPGCGAGRPGSGPADGSVVGHRPDISAVEQFLETALTASGDDLRDLCCDLLFEG